MSRSVTDIEPVLPVMSMYMDNFIVVSIYNNGILIAFSTENHDMVFLQ